MRITGIIAEYNPFHLGHLYQLEAARRGGATHIVVVMGGNWLQRGAPALCEKHARARAALLCGADLVLELPLPYACATGERFAFGGVSLLAALGCVDTLSFGSESGDPSRLAVCAAALDDPAFGNLVRRQLDKGLPFAAARQAALSAAHGPEVASLLSTPNDSLAVEYLRQLSRLAPNIRPFAVLRQGAGHHSAAPPPGSSMASATQLRRLFEENQGDKALAFMPPAAHQVITQALAQGLGLVPSRWNLPMLARLRTLTPGDFARCPDVTEGLEHRLYAAVRGASSVEEALSLAQTKRYTNARLRRILLCAALGIPADLCQLPPPYLHLLGMTPAGEEVLARAKASALLPLSHSLAFLERSSPTAARFTALEASSTDLYTLSTPHVLPCGLDYTSPVITTMK